MTLFTVSVVHDIGPKLSALISLGTQIMSKLDELKAANAAADAAIARVSEDVTFLNDRIAALEAKGDAFTAEESAELASLKDKLAQLDPVPSNPPVEPPAA